MSREAPLTELDFLRQRVAELEAHERERKVAEEALRESEERFRGLAQAMPVMVWTTGPDGYADYSNQRWLEYTGQTLTQSYGLGWLQAVHPEDHERIREAWRKAAAARAAYELDYRVRRGSDGQWRWHLLRSFPLKNPQGEVAKWIGTSTDIHDRFEEERRVQELNEMLRFHVENTPLAVVECAAPDFRITRWSKRAQEIFGWTEEEVLGKPLATSGLMFEHDVHIISDTATEMLAGRQLANVRQIRNIAKDGSIKTMNWYNSARLDADGRLATMFSLGLDVTEQFAGVQAVRRSEARFRRLVERSIFGVVLSDVSGGIEYANDHFLRLLGYSREEFEREGLKWTQLTPPEWLHLDWNSNEELKRYGASAPYEKEYLRKDGSRVPILIGSILLDEPYDEQEHTVAFVMDMTGIKRVQRELERSNEELQQFAYTASHDLQEPIRTVVNFTQLLARQNTGKLSREADEYISFILEASDRMSKLVSSLLEYSRVSQQPELKREAVDLDRVFDHVMRLLSFSVSESGAEVTHDPFPVVWGDESQIAQLMQNLIGNAIKYRRAEEPPRIHLSVSLQGRQWLFALRDNGLGFAPQYSENIFGVFKRLHGRQYSGTGIGLAICRKIVERHGGRIWAESAGDGQGATFQFTLPMVPEERRQ